MLSAALGIAALFAIAASAPTGHTWPERHITADMQLVAGRVVQQWVEQPIRGLGVYEHSPLGVYLHRGKPQPCKPTEDKPFDEHGVPMLIWKGQAQYHPVITAQCGLSAFTLTFLEAGDGREQIRLMADKLIDLQDDRGAFRYPFAWRHYLAGNDLQPGWPSAMAQGKAMSLLARAYMMFGDERYLAAGRKALGFMLLQTRYGGVMTTLADLHPSLSDFVFFEEYVSDPANYVLNGYIFALIGLYDWSQIPPEIDADQDRAKHYFDEGIKSLTHILPYYDLGNVSSYDLGYITFKKRSKVKPGYHMLHIMQLNVLYKITGEPVLKVYADRWWGYVQNPTIPDRIRKMISAKEGIS